MYVFLCTALFSRVSAFRLCVSGWRMLQRIAVKCAWSCACRVLSLCPRNAQLATCFAACVQALRLSRCLQAFSVAMPHLPQSMSALYQCGLPPPLVAPGSLPSGSLPPDCAPPVARANSPYFPSGLPHGMPSFGAHLHSHGDDYGGYKRRKVSSGGDAMTTWVSPPQGTEPQSHGEIFGGRHALSLIHI